MKFSQYITEKQEVTQSQLDYYNELIKVDCKPYLNLIKGKDPLYRGMYVGGEAAGTKKVRTDRIPKGMDKITFEKFNKWLQKNKHNRRDQSVICTSNLKWAKSFSSKLYVIFPIGKFSYTWIASKDVNVTDNSTGWDNMSVESYFVDIEPQDDSTTSSPFEFYFHTDKGFNIAYGKGYELWVKCDSYHYIQVGSSWVWDSKYQVLF